MGDTVKISIACVGKIKEKFYRDAISEYEKRLSRYCKLEFLEVADEKTPDGASASLEEQIKEKRQGGSWSESGMTPLSVLWRFMGNSSPRKASPGGWKG